jgi:hypothetical protein
MRVIFAFILASYIQEVFALADVMDGVWIKYHQEYSGDYQPTTGWHTRIGPDLFLIDGQEVQCVFLLSTSPNRIFEFQLDKDSLISKAKENYRLKISIENGHLKIAGEDTDFYYFRLDTLPSKKDAITQRDITGEWLFQNDAATLNFYETCDSIAEKLTMSLTVDGKKHDGFWDLLHYEQYTFLCMLFFDSNESKLVLIQGLHPNTLSFSYATKSGEAKKGSFVRKIAVPTRSD